MGTGLGAAAHCATVLLAREGTWKGPETEELNRQNLTPHTGLRVDSLLSAAASGPSLPFCWLLTLMCDMSQCPQLAGMSLVCK